MSEVLIRSFLTDEDEAKGKAGVGFLVISRCQDDGNSIAWSYAPTPKKEAAGLSRRLFSL
ncbi:hypothetical protein [Xanthomonas arboricola]|uniref:hypothetical protein n=1 Tax=Xanthomonas arboricola TaxID=56448 RepID=UPI0011AFF292|nr:hypothetical protein [Xanthomonas arboricola]